MQVFDVGAKSALQPCAAHRYVYKDAHIAVALSEENQRRREAILNGRGYNARCNSARRQGSSEPKDIL